MNLSKIIQFVERKIFTLINDVNNQTLYIPRDIYEECIRNGIEMSSKPKIIMDKNYYSITRSQLKELEGKANYKGIEREIHLAKEEGSSKLDNVIFAYKDGVTQVIYIPVIYSQQTSGNTRTILNKKCRATYERELEKILNKKIIIVTVFLKPDEIKEIDICQADNQFFIKEEDAITYGLNLTDRKKIKVDGVLFVEISQEEINLIHIIATKEDCKVSFNRKEIYPKKR